MTTRREPCSMCGKECSVNADGTIRHHLTDNPNFQAGPDSRKCRGAGLPSASPGALALAEDMADGPQCRLCKHPVQLTSNGRARSHLTTEQTPRPCPGGSDYPFGEYPDKTGTTDGLVATLAFDCEHVPVGACYDCHADAEPAEPTMAERLAAEPEQPAEELVLLPLSKSTRAEAERFMETVASLGSEDRRTPKQEAADARTSKLTARAVDALNRRSPEEKAETAARMDRTASAVLGLPVDPELNHEYTDPSGTEWIHDGPAEACQTADCETWRRTHPDGVYCVKCDTDDHRCPGCGTDVPHAVVACDDCVRETCTHPNGFQDTADDTRVRLGDLLEGDHFTRRGTLMRVTGVIRGTVLAVVVDGQMAGRAGELKNPDELVDREPCRHSYEPDGDGGQVCEHCGAPATKEPKEEENPCDTASPSSRPVAAAATSQRSSVTVAIPPTKPAAPAPGSRPPTKANAPAVRPKSESVTSSAPTASASGRGGSAVPEARTRKESSVTTDQAAAAAFLGSGRPVAAPASGANGDAAAAAQFLAGGSGSHGEKETKRDRFNRYLLPHPDTGREQAWTRATTFAKSISDTYALSQWGLRMALLGATQRPDIVARAHGKHVSADKALLDELTAELKNAAGDKVAANLGTAMHSFTELADRAWHSPGGPLSVLDSVPPDCRADVETYIRLLQETGLEPVPHLIEFTTLVKQYGVAGTSDNCYKVTKPLTLKIGRGEVHLVPGEYVIGDKKGLALTEKIPTPDGWTTMGEVKVGDTVFDAYGKPCEVLEKSQVKRIGTYIVRFDDGSSVVCDSEHIWWTATGTRPGEPEARGIAEVIATLTGPNGQKQHRVPVAGPLDLPAADLPIDPYLLGCWLGDGASRTGSITKGTDLFEILEADGHRLGVEQAERGDCVTRTVLGLRTLLIEHDLVHNKHIPTAYLRASVEQRTALLRGLMDTDGCWNKPRREAVFTTVDKALALQVEELLLALGQRVNVAESTANGFGKDATYYRVAFTPVDLQPFRLPRKADQAAASTKPLTRARRRVIVAVDPGPDVETACIGVSSPTRTYLCGDQMIPTHNTGKDLDYGWQEIAIQLAVYAQGLNTCGRWDRGEKKWYPDPLNGVKVRLDAGIVVHLPVDKSGKKAPAVYGVDLESGWNAAVLCERVRAWRKVRKLASPVMVSQAEVFAPVRPEARPVRPPTLRDKAEAVTSKGEASAVWQEAVAAGLPGSEVDGLVDIMQAKLRKLAEPGG